MQTPPTPSSPRFNLAYWTRCAGDAAAARDRFWSRCCCPMSWSSVQHAGPGRLVSACPLDCTSWERAAKQDMDSGRIRLKRRRHLVSGGDVVEVRRFRGA